MFIIKQIDVAFDLLLMQIDIAFYLRLICDDNWGKSLFFMFNNLKIAVEYVDQLSANLE